MMKSTEKKILTSSCKIIKVGVLACQGSFSEHVEALKSVSNIENGRRFILDVIEVRLEHNESNLGRGVPRNVLLAGSAFHKKLKVLSLSPINE
jgi:hypothetical protein